MHPPQVQLFSSLHPVMRKDILGQILPSMQTQTPSGLATELNDLFVPGFTEAFKVRSIKIPEAFSETHKKLHKKQFLTYFI